MNPTFLEFIGANQRSSCGYCKNDRGERTPARSAKKNAETGEEDLTNGLEEELEVSSESSVTTALVIHTISPDNFMWFAEAGWSTSGRYLYKPDNRVTCCPQYTIRLDVTKFKMSRSQKRAMRQMNEFLATGKRPVCGIKEEDAPVEMNLKGSGSQSEQSKKNLKSHEVSTKKMKDADRPVLTKKEIRNKKFEEKCRQKNLDPDVVRTERRQKDAARQRTIQSYIDEARPDWKHKLEVKLVSLGGDEFGTRDNESFELYKNYQHTIHKDEDCRLAGFRRFLCDSPLKKEQRGGIELGSFHLWFLLDDKLIAVCVVDILPKCFSAKYMYYNPEYSFLSLGTYTALREIEQTQRLHAIYSNLKYYYMGYYIHSCPKMRYKAKFRPSDLLCDQSFRWVDFNSCRDLLDGSTCSNGFSEFCPGAPRPASPVVDTLLVFSNGSITTLSDALTEIPEAAENEQFLANVRDLAHLVGPDLSRVVYYFNELNS
ncbi:Arginyl-tRNA--protein transferase 1 [Caenorhabditis elegans]|uniref:Arginyl-tRNA--protein transferase 1 n=2 Tax=Caenorhabditis elegans TaxID=6239 RepID=A0A1N7SZF7_CAEEL|nr:Arginyl-tRNA--protein transferase 1 [Caenorhabditis elegans]SIT60417.1 Arginyl-tRNA--protein transferase 1 [Caenorhabditis elegans]|eukprot:NP_001335527.1 Arginyl-tRNA--protein transferase 1 [Caenorhabditis elegans]